MVPIFNKNSFNPSAPLVRRPSHDDENIEPLQKVPARTPLGTAEVNLERRRCIKFACAPQKEASKPSEEPKRPQQPPAQVVQTTPKRVTTIKFACPAKVSHEASSLVEKPRMIRAVSPAPQARDKKSSPKAASKSHRDSNSTVTNSPIQTRTQVLSSERSRRLSVNSDLARTEALRFHEFASSEEEIEEWTQESTVHRSRLTVEDTLKIENTLRRLGQEAEDEADEDEDEDEDIDDVDENDEDDDLDDIDDLDDEEGDDSEDDGNDDEKKEYSSDEGFQTDDEHGFAVSDDESDAGSDFAWWTPALRPGAESTAATSMDQLDYIRPSARRSVSESSIASVNSTTGDYRDQRPLRRKKSRPVNIRVPSPELPDSTDFVCGTLDEDRPLEAAYIDRLERRRAAKHKLTPQDIDPTFPTSDPEIDEEDDDEGEPDRLASESDAHLMMHGPMDAHLDPRGRSRGNVKRSPAVSPKRLRSPPPPCKRPARSPPPRKLFGQSPRRHRSPMPATRLRSPPPTRRGSTQHFSPRRPDLAIRFGGLAERPALTMSSSLPRTPVTTVPPPISEDEETACEMPVSRRAIDIRVGLEKKRQRRREQLYRKAHRKGAKEKRPPPGKGYERMKEMGLGLAAHRGKNPQLGYGFGAEFGAFGMAGATPDQNDMHVLSV